MKNDLKFEEFEEHLGNVKYMLSELFFHMFAL